MFRTLYSRCFKPGLGLTVVSLALTFGTSALRAEAPAAAPIEGQPYEFKIPGSDVVVPLVPIPGGKFLMGSAETEKKRKPDEGPQVEVKIDPFWMEKHEVTWGEYNLFLQNYQRIAGLDKRPTVPADQAADAVTYPTPMYELEAGPKLDRMGRGPDFPAVIMSHYAAKQYCKWLSKKTGRFYRLPTEAEWEYACRAGTTTAFSFGDNSKDLKDYGWYVDNSALKDGDNGYHKVMLKKPNPWGLYDMYGNVAELVFDQYDAGWYNQFQGKQVTWHDVISWPTKQYPRIARGGGWDSDPDDCRSAARYAVTKNDNKSDPQLPQSPHWLTEGFWIGFRVIAPVKEPSEVDKLKFWEIDNDYVRTIIEKDRAERQAKEIVKQGATVDEPKQ